MAIKMSRHLGVSAFSTLGLTGFFHPPRRPGVSRLPLCRRADDARRVAQHWFESVHDRLGVRSELADGEDDLFAHVIVRVIKGPDQGRQGPRMVGPSSPIAYAEAARTPIADRSSP